MAIGYTSQIMKAWRVEQWCEPEQMPFTQDVPVPVAGPGQTQIAVKAAALNFFDILQIQRKYQVKPPFPFPPRADLPGIDTATGKPVLAIVQQGGFAEYAVADEVFPIPDGFDFAQAAAFPIVYQTGYFALVTRAQLQPGECLLVHAGASGVGMAAIQIGKALGAHVIATASTEEKREFACKQGADAVFDYSTPAWIDAVKGATNGRGADVIYDPVGGDIFDQSTKCIASEGRLLVIGFASGRIPELAVNRALLKNMSVVGVFWGGYVKQHPGYTAECHNALASMAAAGKLMPQVPKTYRLDEAPRALRDLANRAILGKAVLIP